jgi:hypothetical protein
VAPLLGPADRETTARQYYAYAAFIAVLAIAMYLYLHHGESVGGTVALPAILFPEAYAKLRQDAKII